MLFNFLSYLDYGFLIGTQLSFFISFLFSCLFFPPTIKYFAKIQKYGQPIRLNGPKSHINKKYTPTMGGVIIIISILLSIILFANFKTYDIWLILCLFISFSVLGIADDILKLKYYNSIGLSAKAKLIAQFIITVIFLIALKYINYHNTFTSTHLLYGNLINFGILYLPFASLTIVGYANAVNLTDGLDGLVTLPLIIVLSSIMIVIIYSDNLQEYINIMLLCAAIIGSLLGFLWFNAPPAKIFMGDVGSLALGGLVGFLTVIIKYEILFAFIGGLFVIETLSVLTQVLYFKITNGKRIFRMTPIHHHFEHLGWKEQTIVIRFWIISIVFALTFLSIYLYNLR